MLDKIMTTKTQVQKETGLQVKDRTHHQMKRNTEENSKHKVQQRRTEKSGHFHTPLLPQHSSHFL